MNGTLFMADQYMTDICFRQCIIDIDDGSAGISENRRNFFFFQYFHQYLCTGQFHGVCSFKKKSVIGF